METDPSTTSCFFPPNRKVRAHCTNRCLYIKVSTGLGPALTPKLLLQFINQQGNILLALSGDSPTPSAISSLLLELDVHIAPDRTSVVLDHFHYDASTASEQHDVLLLPRPSPLRSDVRTFFGGHGTVIFPRAVAQELGNETPLLVSILRAKTTAYSYNPKEEFDAAEDPFAVGEQISLVSAMQARNSARFTVFGSAEALENRWFDAQIQSSEGISNQNVNRDFAAQVSAWTFQELGVLKVSRVEHHLSSIGGNSGSNDNVVQLGYLNPTIYRIKNDVVRCSLLWDSMHELILVNRPLTLKYLNMISITLPHSRSAQEMQFNSNSPCFRHFIASTSYQYRRH